MTEKLFITTLALLFITALPSSALAQGTTPISFPYTQSFSKAGEKTKLLHDVTWNLTLTFNFNFPVNIETAANATEADPD